MSLTQPARQASWHDAPIARDLSKQGIRICTSPGVFDTRIRPPPDHVRDSLTDMVQYPKRMGLPPEFALLSEQIVENPYLNGETIRLDGGIRVGLSSSADLVEPKNTEVGIS